MARPRNTDRPKELKFSLPGSIAEQIELFTLDPHTGRPVVGLRSKITAALWEALLDQAASGEQFDSTKALNLLRQQL